jgi:phosphatidate cytidylyltransferase
VRPAPGDQTRLCSAEINSSLSGPLRRWLTAVTLGPLLVALTLWGPRWSFVLLVAVTIAVSLREYFRMVSPEAGARAWLWTAAGAALPAAFALGGAQVVLAVLVLGTIGFLSAFVLKGDLRPSILDVLGRELAGLAYVALLLSYFVLLRDLEAGRAWVLFVIAVAFAEDTGAYYVGRAVGGKKLCPRLSPGKTVAGALGGLGAAVAAALAFQAAFMPRLDLGTAAILGLLIGVAGQWGDLFESLLKRASGVKDSGRLLPGHGGLLDRIDSLIFSAPLVYYYNLFLLNSGAG